jgi:hypothetical protein
MSRYDGAADGDPHPEYGHQLIRLSYRLPAMPRELRMVCLASFSDHVLDPYADDPRYVFRWLVDEGLDPQDQEIFQIVQLCIDGRPLPTAQPRPLEVAARRCFIGGC